MMLMSPCLQRPLTWIWGGLAICAAIAGCSEHESKSAESPATENPEPESRSNDEPGSEQRGAGASGGVEMSASGVGGAGNPAKPATEAGRPGSAAGSGGVASTDAGAMAQGGAGAGAAGASGAAGAAGATGAAETAGASGAVAAAGSGGSGDYSTTRCPNAAPPPELPADATECDGSVTCGGAAHCLPNRLLEGTVDSDTIRLMPSCTGGKCVVDVFRGGKFQFKPCTGELGDGRCVAECVAVTVMPLSAIFEVGGFGCGRYEVCVPCGLSGASTGLCEPDRCAEGSEP